MQNPLYVFLFLEFIEIACRKDSYDHCTASATHASVSVCHAVSRVHRAASLLKIAYCLGLCCPWHATSNVKCACDDGTHGNTFLEKIVRCYINLWGVAVPELDSHPDRNKGPDNAPCASP